MTVMVVGGAGYIGAHVVRLLQEAGVGVVVVDDLSTSNAGRIGDSPLVELDAASPEAVEVFRRTIREYDVDSVIHFAARKQVGESMERPLYYYAQNVGGLVNVLEAMQAEDVKKIIFSSSAAVYGMPQNVDMVIEETPCEPINPYGRTKLIGEYILADCARAWGLSYAALRYFNVAGAGWPELGDEAILNLMTMVFDRLERGERPLVFGDDYLTEDGTCIRDYVHVKDLAVAHIKALDVLDKPGSEHVFNVGTGTGASVLEVIEAIGRASGRDTTPIIKERRPGDPPRLVASAKKIERDLDFVSTTGLDEIVDTAWKAWRFQHD
ncbi:UDP-galactose 4-epimerase [Ruaniaceae bacterium KH17]|nr:UDP-galactose 4-epimerase [Ruaniaceae bacterium KH17]